MSIRSTKVDVVVVCHNHEDLTRQFYDTFRETVPEGYATLWFVDNASSDGTPAFLNNLAVSHPDVNVVRTEVNVGWVRGVNKAAPLGDAPYVLIANNDLVFRQEGWLERLVAHLENDPRAGAVGPTSNFVMGFQQAGLRIPDPHAYVNFLIGFCCLVRREAFKGVGWLDEAFANCGADDLDLSLRLRQAGWKLVRAGDVFVEHLGERTGRDVLPDYRAFHEEGVKTLERKWGKGTYDALFKQPSVLISTPVYPNDPRVNCHLAQFYIASTHRDDWRVGVDLVEGKPIDAVRRRQVKRFLDLGYDWLLMIDADITPPAEAPWRVFNLMKHDLPVVGAVCFSFQFQEPFAVVLEYVPEEDGYRQVERLEGLVEVDATGMSCIAIHRSVFEKVKPPYFVTKIGDDGDIQRGEDFWFCERVREAGFKIHVDCSIVCGHIVPVDLAAVNRLAARLQKEAEGNG